jgi:hypothetical protein
VPKGYQTPYGEVEVARHIYQEGGKTFFPLEREARRIVTSTPRFAKEVAHQFAHGESTQGESDLEPISKPRFSPLFMWV